MIETPNTGSSDEERALAIGRLLQAGKKVEWDDQLLYYKYRKKKLSLQLKTGGARAHIRHERVDNKIKELEQLIMNSGDLGGGVMSQGSGDLSHNNPRR
jgi:hypothetical protein